MVLFVNCCPRDESRTKIIANALLKKLGDYEEIDLNKSDLLPMDQKRLMKRDKLLEEGQLNAEMFAMARQFAAADCLVIAAPFWDLSFPSLLKLYIENIYVTGIVTTYDAAGTPIGLCRAKSMYYVTTAGGPYDGRFSYDYLSSLCRNYFGIPETKLIVGEMLDIDGYDADEIVRSVIERL